MMQCVEKNIVIKTAEDARVMTQNFRTIKTRTKIDKMLTEILHKITATCGYGYSECKFLLESDMLGVEKDVVTELRARGFRVFQLEIDSYYGLKRLLKIVWSENCSDD